MKWLKKGKKPSCLISKATVKCPGPGQPTTHGPGAMSADPTHTHLIASPCPRWCHSTTCCHSHQAISSSDKRLVVKLRNSFSTQQPGWAFRKTNLIASPQAPRPPPPDSAWNTPVIPRAFKIRIKTCTGLQRPSLGCPLSQGTTRCAQLLCPLGTQPCPYLAQPSPAQGSLSTCARGQSLEDSPLSWQDLSRFSANPHHSFLAFATSVDSCLFVVYLIKDRFFNGLSSRRQNSAWFAFTVFPVSRRAPRA